MLYILLALAVCGADQLLKAWVSGHIALGGKIPFLPGVMSLTNLHNTGMAFSLFSRHTWALALVSALVAAALIWLLFRGRFTRWEKLAMAMILGGAVGNLIDRVRLGYVVDMFHTDFVNFAVFNLADAFIDVGAVLFCLLYILRSIREERRRAEEKAHDGDADSH